MKGIDLHDISIEISAVSAMVSAISNQCNNEYEHLKNQYLNLALSGVSKHLDRIAEEINVLNGTKTYRKLY